MTPLRTIAEVAERVPERPERVIVGIAGPPGSGKSTIGALLVDALDSSMLLGMDGFHLTTVRLAELGRRDRMGAVDTFDVEAFVTTLQELRFTGGPVSAPGFDREAEEPVPGAIVIPPEIRVIVVEGNYLLHDSAGWERVAPLLDVTFFVRLDDRIRIQRLVQRHIRFGKSVAAAAAWATGPDEVNARLIAATAARAGVEIELG